MPDAALIERFLSMVDKRVSDQCWNWTGPRFVQGYGRFCIGQKSLKAHRWSWELHNGKAVPAGLVICHACDNKLCVNPDHLRAATQAFNNFEAVDRGRWKPNYGTANGRSVLTPEQASEIRNSRERQVALAAKYGITQSQVSRVQRGECWNIF
jgi:hypothetical protein